MWLGLTTEVLSDETGSTGLRTRWIDGMYDAYTHFAPGTTLAENQCFIISSDRQKGEWLPTLDCNLKLPFVCKMELKEAMVDWDNDDPRVGCSGD